MKLKTWGICLKGAHKQYFKEIESKVIMKELISEIFNFCATFCAITLDRRRIEQWALYHFQVFVLAEVLANFGLFL